MVMLKVKIMRTVAFISILTLSLVACSSEPRPERSSPTGARAETTAAIPSEATVTVAPVATTSSPLTFAAARRALIKLVEEHNTIPLSLTLERLRQTPDEDVNEGEVCIAGWNCNLTTHQFGIDMGGQGVCLYSVTGDFIVKNGAWQASVTEESWATPGRR